MLPWIVAAAYACGILAAIEAVKTARTSQGAVAWAVSLQSMPFVALPAYLVFGHSKFDGTRAAYEQRKQEIDTLVAEARRKLEPWGVDATEQASYHPVRKLSGTDPTRGNQVTLLVNGEATFDSILTGIIRARHYALVQFYMFHADALGRRMQQALMERLRAGVRVCMLYNQVGSKGLPRRHLDELRGLRIRFYAYKPGFLHEKVMLIDDEVTALAVDRALKSLPRREVYPHA